MRIWLKGTTDEIEVGFNELVEAEVFNERPRVHKDDHSGQSYIEVYDDPVNPTSMMPDIPDEMIGRVTLRNSIYRGLRTEGLYELGDARLMVTTNVRVHSEMMADRIEREEWQSVDVSAPTVESLIEIYKAVRSGKLQPEENWEAPSVSDSKVRYFRVDFREGMETMEAVWSKQDEMRSPPSHFSSSAVGTAASIWTKDPHGEELFRLELQERGVQFEEGDEQQIAHGLDQILAEQS